MNRRKWASYVWPEWVPLEVRKQVEGFWSDEWNRGPDEWLANTADPYAGQGVTLGTRGTFWVIGHRALVVGRYVHAWNNIGRAVLEDGTFEYVSGGLATLAQVSDRAARIQTVIDSHLEVVKQLEAERRDLRAFIDLEARKEAHEPAQ